MTPQCLGWERVSTRCYFSEVERGGEKEKEERESGGGERRRQFQLIIAVTTTGTTTALELLLAHIIPARPGVLQKQDWIDLERQK